MIVFYKYEITTKEIDVAKKKKRNSEIDTVVGTMGAEALGLKPPFAASPSRPPSIGMYLTKGENRGYKSFCAIYAARKFLDVLFEDDGLTRIKGISGEQDTVLCDNGIAVRIVCTPIDDVLKHEYSTDEDQWELSDEYVQFAQRFRSMGFDAPVYASKAEGGEAKPERVKKEPKAPRPSKDGMTTIQQIAEELKMEPREARGILRKMKTVKPEVGWAFKGDDIKKIKSILEKNREK